MKSAIKARVLLPVLAVAAATGLLGFGPPSAPAGQPHQPATNAMAADPCYPTGTLPGPFATAKTKPASKPSLTVTGPKAPYIGEPTLYCGTLTLPGRPVLQPVELEVDGKVVASADAGVDRSWHAYLALTGRKPAAIRAVWHRGQAGQLTSAALTVAPNPAPDARPTSLDLISLAVAAHRITRSAGLVDDVYALLAPQKLPKSLTGTRPMAELGDSDAMAAVADGWRSLNVAQKSAILSLLGGYRGPKAKGRRPAESLPPLACGYVFEGYGGVPGSKVAIPPFGAKVPAGWTFIGTRHFKIWYPTTSFYGTDAAAAKATAQYLATEAEKVWDAETGLFGRTPVSDLGERCNGGDGRLDIYVYKKSFSTYAETFSFNPATCKHTPVWMFVSPEFADSPRYAQAALAHEFFHAVELAFTPASPCFATGWLGEATGNWAIDYVYPDNNFEQHYAFDYFDRDYRYPLDQGGYDRHPGYDDYLYLFFLARQFDPGVVASIWKNLEHADPRHAIDQAVPGGVGESWHQFALDNWNRKPLDDYTAWDGIPFMLKDDPFAEIDLDGKHTRVFPTTGQTETSPLSSKYQYWTIVDKNVAEVTFNKYGFTKPAKPGMRIDALLELADGQFEQQDWSSGADKTLCRQQPDQNVASVLLMYSNGNLSDDAVTGAGEKVTANDTCPVTGYKGTIKNVLTINNSSESMTQTANATVTFKYDGAVSNPGVGQYQFDTTGGKVKLKVDGTSGPCTISGSGSFAIAKWQPPGSVTGPGGQVIANDGISPKSPYSGTGAATGAPPINSSNSCVPGSVPYYMEGQWWATDNGTPTNKIKYHQELTGSYTTTGPDGLTNTWTWNLQPIFGS